jgi:hypothetical protein
MHIIRIKNILFFLSVSRGVRSFGSVQDIEDLRHYSWFPNNSSPETSSFPVIIFFRFIRGKTADPAITRYGPMMGIVNRAGMGFIPREYDVKQHYGFFRQ